MSPKISYIKRDLELVIHKYLDQGKNPNLRSTTSGKNNPFVQSFPKNSNTLFLSCDQARIQEQLTPDALSPGEIIGRRKIIIFDEAQYLDNPGLVLKILVDNFSDRKIIATGSSSFDLASKVSEPLTGRHFQFLLLPFSVSEIRNYLPSTDIKFYLDQALLCSRNV